MSKCKVIAIVNQKGGTGKTTTTVNLGIGLTDHGKKVLLVDVDPQGDLTTALGWADSSNMITLASQMEKLIRDEPMDCHEGILHHDEGVDVIPSNIELSGMEMALVNTMSREFMLKTYLDDLKKDYDYILLDCMPSLGILAVSDFPNHPFKVRMDENMQKTVESVREYGVLVPAIVRLKADGRYEMVSGHRRKRACELAGKTEIPCIVRNLNDDDGPSSWSMQTCKGK